MEADFQQYYNLDINPMLETVAGRTRASRLMFQLPRDCRLYVAVQPANQWGWAEVFANKMPKPFIPEFMQAPKEPSPINRDTELHTTDEIRAILAMPRG